MNKKIVIALFIFVLFGASVVAYAELSPKVYSLSRLRIPDTNVQVITSAVIDDAGLKVYKIKDGNVTCYMYQGIYCMK